jgi:lysophospholipase L1-like esterase
MFFYYLLFLLALLILLFAIVFALFVFIPGQRIPAIPAQYVALGSSFAAGLGLGKRVHESSISAGRTVNSYPQKFSRMTGLSLVDMTWSGSTSKNILKKGTFFQRPQIDGVGPNTELVTITTGGNDMRYGVDLMLLSYRNKNATLRFLIDSLFKSPLPVENRNFGIVYDGITSAIAEIKKRAPKAAIVVVTYPPVLPERGGCECLGLTNAQILLMLPVAKKLALITKEAARDGGARVLDMATIGIGHEACSDVPWTNGAITKEAAFHPSNAGTEVIASKLATMLRKGDFQNT